MKLLLDSHALIWWMDQHDRISIPAFTAIEDGTNELLVSISTVWELGIKVGLRRLNLEPSFAGWMEAMIEDLDATLLPISIIHVERQTTLPYHHRDPFDRLLVAQALTEDLTIISRDTSLDSYGVRRVW